MNDENSNNWIKKVWDGIKPLKKTKMYQSKEFYSSLLQRNKSLLDHLNYYKNPKSKRLFMKIQSS